jgi:hypothetical protein
MTEPITPFTTGSATQYSLTCPQLPLAVYGEIAAHLRQVKGVDTDLLPQRSQQFDYRQSQVGGIQISYSPDADGMARQRVEQILSYYADRFGTWERLIP